MFAQYNTIAIITGLLQRYLKMVVIFGRDRNPAERLLKSLHMSVRPYAWNNSRKDKQVLMKFYIGGFYEKLSRNFGFHFDRAILTTTVSLVTFGCHDYLVRGNHPWWHHPTGRPAHAKVTDTQKLWHLTSFTKVKGQILVNASELLRHACDS
jgi:hypothetical protein